MFKDRLKELRKSNGYSMDDLCQIYNKQFNGRMNKSTLSRYENGLQEPLFTVVKNLAYIFNVSVDYLSNEEKNSSEKSEEFEESVTINRNGKKTVYKIPKEKLDALEPLIKSLKEQDDPDL